jgi:hypothetical protein
LHNGADALASMRNCIRPERLTFHAELSASGAERLEASELREAVWSWDVDLRASNYYL